MIRLSRPALIVLSLSGFTVQAAEPVELNCIMEEVCAGKDCERQAIASPGSWTLQAQLDPETMTVTIKGFPDSTAQLGDDGVLRFLAGDDEVTIHRDTARITVIDPVTYLDALGTCRGDTPLW